jgi:hypothetical protein
MDLEKLSDRLERVLDIVGMALLIVIAVGFTIATVTGIAALIFVMIRAAL